MTRAIDAIKAHHATLEPVTIEVPEWELSVYVWPPTMGEQSKLLRKSKALDDVETAIEMVIMFARDADKTPLFTTEDKPELRRHADPSLFVDLALKITNAHDLTEEQAEKN